MKKMFFAAAALWLAVSCAPQRNDSIPEWPWEDPKEEEQPPVEEDGDWTDITSKFELPEHIKIYQNSGKLQEQNAVAFIATCDTHEASFEVWGINAPDLNGSSEPLQTPKQVYDANDKPSVVINAGFFYTSGGKSYSSSLEVSEGTLLSPNINYASQDWVTMYSPTRGAFIEHKDGSYEVAWTFWKNGAYHYVYSEPANNSWDAAPLKTPDATFPCEGVVFEAVNAIGGGPVLIKDGEIVNSFAAELFNGPSGIMCEARHPRTAVGFTSDERLVFFVCEGRNMTEGVPGFTTEEVANILLDFGCVSAMNLDGGGSTLMLVNGEEMMLPSDGKERAVASTLMFR